MRVIILAQNKGSNIGFFDTDMEVRYDVSIHDIE